MTQNGVRLYFDLGCLQVCETYASLEEDIHKASLTKTLLKPQMAKQYVRQNLKINRLFHHLKQNLKINRLFHHLKLTKVHCGTTPHCKQTRSHVDQLKLEAAEGKKK